MSKLHIRWPQSLSWTIKANCLLCDRPVNQGIGALLCGRCLEQLQHCRLKSDQFAPTPADRGQPDRQLIVWGQYQDSLRRLLHQLKYQNQPATARILGQQLAQTWQQQQRPRLTVIPIPLHADRQIHRGYNQAELIAQSFCQFTGMSCQAHRLQRHKATQAQHGLTRDARQANLQAAFRASPPHRHQRPILLIDDIYTTGATIKAATDCLTAQGYTVWGSLIVAR